MLRNHEGVPGQAPTCLRSSRLQRSGTISREHNCPMASGKLVAPVAFSQPRDHAHLHIWLIPGSEAPCERHSWIALCLYVSTCLINKTQSQSRSQSASRGLPHTQIWALQCPQTKPLIHRDRVQWEPKRGQSGAERPIQAFWVKSCIKMPFYSDEATLSLPVFLKVTILPCWISLLLIQQPTVMMSQDSTFVILGLEIRGDWGRECDRRQK